jgi:small-conductance mechanosensitive channel
MIIGASPALVRLLFAIVLSFGFVHLNAEETAVAPAEPADKQEAAKPIKLDQIPARLASSGLEARRLAALAIDQQQLERISIRLAGATERVNARSKDPRLANLSQLSNRSLSDLVLSWRAQIRRLKIIEQSLTDALADAARGLERLGSLREPWRVTLESAAEGVIPESIQTSIRSLLTDIETEKNRVVDFTEQLATLRTNLAIQILRSQENLEQVQTSERDNQSALFRFSAPPVWQIARMRDEAENGDISGVVRDGWRIQFDTLREQWSINSDRAKFWIFIFLAVFATLKVGGRSWLEDVAQTSRTHILQMLLDRPLAAALFLAIAAGFVLLPAPPIIVRDLLKLLLVAPLIVLLRPLLHESLRWPLLILVILYVLDNLRLIVGGHPLIDRVVLIVSSAAGIVTLLLLLRPESNLRHMAATTTPWRIGLLGAQTSTVLLLVSLVLNLLGALSLATLIAEGVFRVAFAGVSLFVLNLVLRGITEAALQSTWVNSSYGIRNNHELIRQRTDTFYRFVCGAILLFTFLDSFHLAESVSRMITSLFNESVTIGTLDLSLSSVVAFIAALWIGVLLSRFIRFILQEDIYPRVQLPRGVPGALTMLVRYSIITLAFLFALAAAGIEIGNFAIIAGALGVGIGFGLQNVVNNFVSGLILAFERPIQNGDVIQFGTDWGKVSVIGIRSSKVRTFDGAEIIVPNGDLISQQLTNWTLSDRMRRMEIQVGVAYGSDPHQMLEILNRTASEQSPILDDPAPVATFIGFGDSSLNFSLKAWTADFDNFLVAKSNLTLAVHDALQAANIVIPFPQRDVHLYGTDQTEKDPE